MSEISSIAVVVLAGVIHASLQLGLGCLLMLYHTSSSKNLINKTRRLVSSFISGIGLIVFLLLAAVCYCITNLFGGSLDAPIMSAVIGALLALAVIMWFFYYRRGLSTELWLPKSVARFIDGRAKVTSSQTESFSLGVLTCFAEMPIAGILMFVAGNSVLELDPKYQLLSIVIYTFIVISPLVIMRIFIRSCKNAVDIQKWRVKNKVFLRTVSGFGFFMLGVYLLTFKIMGGL